MQAAMAGELPSSLQISLEGRGLFASREARSILDEMAEAPGDRPAAVTEPPREIEGAAPAETPPPAVGGGPHETGKSPRDGAAPSQSGPSAGKPRPKAPAADGSRPAGSRPGVYRNDRTARAVKQWRTFHEKKAAEEAGESASPVPQSNKSPSHTNKSKTAVSNSDKSETVKLSFDTTNKENEASSGERGAAVSPVRRAPTEGASGSSRAVSAASSRDNADADARGAEVGLSSPVPASIAPSPSLPPARHASWARYGRRYSMPVIWGCGVGRPRTAGASSASSASPVVSPRHASPTRFSRETSPVRSQPSPSPGRRASSAAVAAHLQSNRERLSALCSERSALISGLVGPGARNVIADSKLLSARLSARRASDTTGSLSDFLQQQQQEQQQRANPNGATPPKILQRRGSLSASLHAADPPRPAPPVGRPSASSPSRAKHGQAKSRSCENVSLTRQPTPCPPAAAGAARPGRRGSVCVGQIARTLARGHQPALQPSPPAGKSPQSADPKSPAAAAATITTTTTIISTLVKPQPIDSIPRRQRAEMGAARLGEEDKGVSQTGETHQGPSTGYLARRRASVGGGGTAHIARAPADAPIRPAQDARDASDSKTAEHTETVPLTLTNLRTHNRMLTPFSLQMFTERIGMIAASRGDWSAPGATAEEGRGSSVLGATTVSSFGGISDDVSRSEEEETDDEEEDDDDGDYDSGDDDDSDGACDLPMRSRELASNMNANNTMPITTPTTPVTITYTKNTTVTATNPIITIPATGKTSTVTTAPTKYLNATATTKNTTIPNASAQTPTTSTTTTNTNTGVTADAEPTVARAATPAADRRPPRSLAMGWRTDGQIVRDIEAEIQERVARRRRELMAARCVSMRGVQRLEARALAQSAAGRLKRNLHEVTKQRKTKELMQIEEERRRRMKQLLLIS